MPWSGNGDRDASTQRCWVTVLGQKEEPGIGETEGLPVLRKDIYNYASFRSIVTKQVLRSDLSHNKADLEPERMVRLPVPALEPALVCGSIDLL